MVHRSTPWPFITVSHNNRRQTISLPFTVTYGRPVGKFDLQLGVGCALNFVGNQTGKTLDIDHQVIAYGNHAAQLPVRRFHLTYHLRPAVTYWATPRIGLRYVPSYGTNGSEPLPSGSTTTIVST